MPIYISAKREYVVMNGNFALAIFKDCLSAIAFARKYGKEPIFTWDAEGEVI